MKKRRFKLHSIVLAVAALSMSGMLAQGQKIGFVSTFDVLRASQEGKARISAWDSAFRAEQEKIKTESDELNKLQQQFAEQRLSLNAETQAEMQQSIQNKATSIKRMQEDLNRTAGGRRDKILAEVSEKIRTLLQDYAKNNGYDAIFLRLPDQQAYVAESVDITAEILRLYDEKYKVPTEAPQS